MSSKPDQCPALKGDIQVAAQLGQKLGHQVSADQMKEIARGERGTEEKKALEELAPAGHPKNSETGHEIGILKDVDHMFIPISFSPDGTRIAVGSHGKTVRVWEPRTDSILLGPLEGHSDVVVDVQYSPDGQSIASGGEDIRCSLMHGKLIASGTLSRFIITWDAKTGKLILGKPVKDNESPDQIDSSPLQEHPPPRRLSLLERCLPPLEGQALDTILLLKNARVNSADVPTRPTSSRGKKFWKTKRSPQRTNSRESDAHSQDRSKRGILRIVFPAKAKEACTYMKQSKNASGPDGEEEEIRKSAMRVVTESGAEQDEDDELPSDHDHGDSDAHEVGQLDRKAQFQPFADSHRNKGGPVASIAAVVDEDGGIMGLQAEGDN
ncbi:hypothetical protein CONPUDRAFT_142220 [Coniophora puteana RWD-64-598 SS2]|uniref:Uncharacterized protein n=1 Tax=Coniophora puteana (strain RWD-64-598) TaxID=741705 RepID=A0A5M3N385_CONPW|nr:uncharacterized protein CONPUDRAFT_142220 [Coniophora puteana RWD-64-598 SS2]EIW85850.1 hypothetical protein CONPUDRAFT_142220 [Coniophora puteana RWD-64-598 SS2]